MFDSLGQVGGQIDIIIYDALYTPLIFGTDAGEKFVTAESVYAVFDSKPEINKETLDYTNQKIASVRSLSRSSRGVINAGQYCKARKLTKILGGILAVESIGIDTIKKHVEVFKNIDLGCSIKKHSFLVDRRDAEIILSHASEDETVLTFFYFIRDELYKLGTVAGIDIRAYANATLENFNFDIEEVHS